jgi:hypothetical protein
VTSHRLWLLIPLIIVALAVLIWFYPSNSDFRVENRSWNGVHDFVTEFQAVTLERAFSNKRFKFFFSPRGEFCAFSALT